MHLLQDVSQSRSLSQQLMCAAPKQGFQTYLGNCTAAPVLEDVKESGIGGLTTAAATIGQPTSGFPNVWTCKNQRNAYVSQQPKTFLSCSLHSKSLNIGVDLFC